MVKKIVLAAVAATLISCKQVGALGINADEHAFACVKADSSLPFLRTAGVTVEVGGTDTSNWGADDWLKLSAICK